MFDPPTQHTTTPAYVPTREPGAYRPDAPRVSWKVVALGIAGCLAIAALAFLVLSAAHEPSAASGVKVVGCSTTQNSAVVGLSVTNSSSLRRDYDVTVDVMWGDELMGTGTIGVGQVDPGQTVRDSGTIQLRGKGDTCVITSVD